MKLEYEFEIREGKIHIFHRTQFDSDVGRLKWTKGIMTLEKKKKKRSLNQNRYWWKILVPIVQQGLNDVGIFCPTPEHAHDVIKLQFLSREEVNQKTGETLKVLGTTTTLSTSEFMDLISEVQAFGAEFLGVTIPSPNEQLEL